MAPKTNDKKTTNTVEKKKSKKPTTTTSTIPKQNAGKVEKSNKTKRELYKNIFQAKPKNFTIGNDIMHSQDLTRFVKWPRYVRIQRQKRILYRRLAVPPSVNQFKQVASKQLAQRVFKFMELYKPEEEKAKRLRLKNEAALKAKGEKIPEVTKKPTLTYGVQEVVAMIERKKAQFVVLAHDVDPIELIIYIPALCRKLNIPYCIIKSKSRLGRLCNKKTATCLALSDFNKEDKDTFDKLVEAVKGGFNEKYLTTSRKWGGGQLSKRSTRSVESKIKNE
jgi:large subunit ribosomal protein L7Ae